MKLTFTLPSGERRTVEGDEVVDAADAAVGMLVSIDTPGGPKLHEIIHTETRDDGVYLTLYPVEPVPVLPPRMAEPEAFVQWKNTEVCLDFQCTCSDPADALEFHYDGLTSGAVRCPRCGAVWLLNQPTVTRLPAGDERAEYAATLDD